MPGEVLENTEVLHLGTAFTLGRLFPYSALRVFGRRAIRMPTRGSGGFAGEKVTRKQLAQRRELTAGDFSLQVIPNYHFFLYTSQDMVREIPARHLANLVDDGA